MRPERELAAASAERHFRDGMLRRHHRRLRAAGALHRSQAKTGSCSVSERTRRRCIVGEELKDRQPREMIDARHIWDEKIQPGRFTPCLNASFEFPRQNACGRATVVIGFRYWK